MAADELADFERRTFREWDPASLGDLRLAIERRRRVLAGLWVKTGGSHNHVAQRST
jgi:hypothetical protein